MATSTTIYLERSTSSDHHVDENTKRASATATKVLQENHNQHHVFFNDEGFHNHITHCILTLWALGASAEQIQKAYDINKVFQRPQIQVDKTVCEDLFDEAKFMSCLGDEKYYQAFLRFFEREIAVSSWQDVVQKYLFAGDKRADSMFVRLFDSFLHPLIHLGFGVEFAQPAVVAEALAQIACHQDWLGELLLPAEDAARENPRDRSIVELLDALQTDTTILQAPHWTDEDKIRDGILGRAGTAMIEYLSQVQVNSQELAAKTAEMVNAAAYLTAAAQRPGKTVKFDFYLLHCLTSAIFFADWMQQDWLSADNKARLLTWKIRVDLVMYASRKSPQLHLDMIRSYRAKHDSDWAEIKARVCDIPDEHAAKLIRSIARGREICREYQDEDRYRLQDADWHQVGLMAIDSMDILDSNVEHAIAPDGPSQVWVRSAGFDEAWSEIPDGM